MLSVDDCYESISRHIDSILSILFDCLATMNSHLVIINLSTMHSYQGNKPLVTGLVAAL